MTGIAKLADMKLWSMAGSVMYGLTKICSSLNEEEEGMVRCAPRTLLLQPDNPREALCS